MSYQNPERKVISDGRNAMRKIDASSTCLSCGKNFKEKLIWFDENKFICPACSGTIDDKPIRELIKNSLKSLKSAISKSLDT